MSSSLIDPSNEIINKRATQSDLNIISNEEYFRLKSELEPKPDVLGKTVTYLCIDNEVLCDNKYRSHALSVAKRIEILNGKVTELCWTNGILTYKIMTKDGLKRFSPEATYKSIAELPADITQKQNDLAAVEALYKVYDVTIGDEIFFFDSTACCLKSAVIKAVSRNDGILDISLLDQYGQTHKIGSELLFVQQNIVDGGVSIAKESIYQGSYYDTLDGRKKLLFAEKGEVTLLFFDNGKGEEDLYMCPIEEIIDARIQNNDKNTINDLASKGFEIGQKLLINGQELTIIGYDGVIIVLNEEVPKIPYEFSTLARIHSSYKDIDKNKVSYLWSYNAVEGRNNYLAKLKLIETIREKQIKEEQNSNIIRPGDTVYFHYVENEYPYNYIAERIPLEVISIETSGLIELRSKSGSHTFHVNIADLYKDSQPFTQSILQKMEFSKKMKDNIDKNASFYLKEKNIYIGAKYKYFDKIVTIKELAGINESGIPTVKIVGDTDVHTVSIDNLLPIKIETSTDGIKVGDQVHVAYISAAYPYDRLVTYGEGKVIAIIDNGRGLKITNSTYPHGEYVANDRYVVVGTTNERLEKEKEAGRKKKEERDKQAPIELEAIGFKFGDFFSLRGGTEKVKLDSIHGYYNGIEYKFLNGIGDTRIGYLRDCTPWAEPNELKPSRLKKEAKNALYRVGAAQLITAVKTAIILILKNKKQESVSNQIADFLKTELGTSFAAAVASTALSQMKTKDQRILGLNRELQISAMAIAGNKVADLLIQELVPQMAEIFRSIEKEGIRLDNTPPSMVEGRIASESEAEELQIRSASK